MYASAEERFWKRIDKTDTCWLWRPPLTPAGYGQFFPTKGTRMLAHRFAYELLVGPIPQGLTLDHLCRVRNCVNPEHLEPVTIGVNGRRGNSPWAINARKTHCPKGHEYDEANTYVSPQGRRLCRACHREYQRIRRSR
jgi:hypothetical protein